MQEYYSYTKRKKNGEFKKLGDMPAILREASRAGGKEKYDNMRRGEGAEAAINAFLPYIERLERKIDALSEEKYEQARSKKPLRRVK